MPFKFITVLAALAAAGFAYAECPPKGMTRTDLVELKKNQFRVGNEDRMQTIALSLLPCLADPDPTLRDEIAFEALSTWMRAKKITTPTALSIRDTLLAQLERPDDSAGFAKPFAALTLAEVARMDRVDSYLTTRQRDEISRRAAAYLRSVRDYRGFDAKQGWRHGVAHGADLLMQLGLNPNLGKAALDENLAALATQIAPQGHSYIYGEPARLATAVFWTAQRGLHSEQEWSAWFATVTNPAPFVSWHEGFSSRAGLAKRHDTLNFLQSLYALVQENGNTTTKERVLPGLRKALELVW